MASNNALIANADTRRWGDACPPALVIGCASLAGCIELVLHTPEVEL